MDTNSIQPIKENELVATEHSSRLLSFERGFLDTTNALGVWPISLLGFLATGTVIGLLTQKSFGWIVFAFYGEIGLVSGFFSLVVWMVLSFFRWPFTLRLIFSAWTSFLVGLLWLFPYFSSIHWNNFFFDPVVLMVILPALIGGFTILMPYIYNDCLLRKVSLNGTSNQILIEKDGDRTHI